MLPPRTLHASRTLMILEHHARALEAIGNARKYTMDAMARCELDIVAGRIDQARDALLRVAVADVEVEAIPAPVAEKV